MIIFARCYVDCVLAKDMVVLCFAIRVVRLVAHFSPLNGCLANRARKTWWIVRPLARAADPTLFGNGASESACQASFVTC